MIIGIDIIMNFLISESLSHSHQSLLALKFCFKKMNCFFYVKKKTLVT